MSLKVLVVDDDEIIVVIHTTLIKKSQLESNPITFFRGKEVVDYIVKNQNSNDKYLIFLDINMPEMNGWEFLESTKKYKENVFVIIVTSSINRVDKEKAKLYDNIIHFIEKPMKKEDCDKIRSLPEIAQYF
jgi:response regulator of citrate/malate metabolism